MSALLELAERCEAATGPDRKLDAMIASSAGFQVVDEGHPLGLQCYNADHCSVALPAYTRSLDAAMTLVPHDTGHAHWSWVGKPPCVSTQTGGAWSEWARAATLPLAYCAAALRARAATTPASLDKEED